MEIGRILHLKSENLNLKLDVDVRPSNLRFRIFGFEMQDSSNFRFLTLRG
jgi:hypothetical protein